MVQIKRPVFFSGENPGMTMYAPGSEQAAAVASYWHCTDSIHGVGHALVLWVAEEAAPAFAPGYILTDNPTLAEALATNLTSHFPEFKDVPIDRLGYLEAQCQHTYDGNMYQVVCQTAQWQISLEWRNILERKQINWPGFPAGEFTYDLTTVICPCQNGQIQLNGQPIIGDIQVIQAEDSTFASSAFLAFAESWIGPLET